MDGRDSVARLTQREKVCLRQWLQHKSAKEIAAELGISHYAVEKRLKMARIKLGATPSLEAARLLGQVEGYGQTATQSPDLASDALTLQSRIGRRTVLGVVIMIFLGAVVLGLLSQPVALSQAPASPPVESAAGPTFDAHATPSAGTEAALRTLVAGLASGSPQYDKLAAPFAEVVRRDLPMTHPMFKALGELKSMTYVGRGEMGDDAYNLVFANGEVEMSAGIDAEGKMLGGMLRPLKLPLR
jgi:DNA-binding CsgD family transcriptional regulator